MTEVDQGWVLLLMVFLQPYMSMRASLDLTVLGGILRDSYGNTPLCDEAGTVCQDSARLYFLDQEHMQRLPLIPFT